LSYIYIVEAVILRGHSNIEPERYEEKIFPFDIQIYIVETAIPPRS